MILYRNGMKWLAVLMIAALAVVGAHPAQAKSPVVTGVQVTGASGNLKVHVISTGDVQHRVLNLNDPRVQLVVEIYPAQLATNVQKSMNVNEGQVEKVRVGQFSDNPDVVRLVVDLKSAVKYQVTTTNGRKGLTLALNTNAVTTAKGTPAVGSTSPRSVAASIAPTVSSSNVARPAVRVAQAGRSDVLPTRTFVAQGVPASAPVEVAQRTSGRRRGVVSRGQRVSLDYVNADLIYVLKQLAGHMKMNLVTDSTVKGSVTVTLKDVPADAALQLILRIANFDSAKFGNTLVVGAPDTLAKIPPDIMGRPIVDAQKVSVMPIVVENRKPGGFVAMVKEAFPEATVKAQDDMNCLLVTASPGQLRKIKELVQRLDVPPPPAVVKKREIVYVNNALLKDVWELVKALNLGINYNVDQRLNALIVEGTDREIEELKAFLATVDVPMQQVMLDIRVVVLTEDGQKALGFTIGSNTGTFGVFGGANGQPIVFTETFAGAAATTPSLAVAPFSRTPFILGASLQMLVSRNDAKVIATPRIMTQSNEQASVNIGDNYPIVYFDPRAGQFQVQYVKIGVELTAKPVVSNDGFVTVDLTPSVSVLKSLINNQYPQTSETKVKTKVRVRDGDTIILGGLLRETEAYTLQKLPFLGDLPVLGEFFRNTKVSRTKDEVFFTVTPKIMP